jgi:MYXO-CTERM domain-containing protein
MMPRTFDFIRVDGAITYNTGFSENITDYFSFDLSDFQYTNGGSNNLGLWSVSSRDVGGDTYISITAVPEPSTYGFGLGALALAAAAIRRRRKNQAKA